MHNIRKEDIKSIIEASISGKQKKKETIKSKVSKRKWIRKIRVEINDIKNRISIDKIDETKIWFFEKINKINKSLSTVINKKQRRQKYQYQK